MSDGIALKGFVTAKLIDKKTGQVKQEVSRPNLIVDVGRFMLASLFNDDGDKPAPVCIAVGESKDSPEVEQTDLQGVELARRDFTTKNRNSDRVTFETLFEDEWTGTIEEAGIFNKNETEGEDPEENSENRGDMAARFLTGTFEKSSQDNLLIVWGMEVKKAE